MKTARYYISFDNLENDMSTPIEISKKEYERQLSFLRNQIEATQLAEYSLEELEEIVHVMATYTKHVNIFTCGCAATTLQKIVCNDGYCFTTKK